MVAKLGWLWHDVSPVGTKACSLGEDFAMQHKDSEYLGELEEELQTAVLEAIPVEKRLQGLPAEEELRRFTPEELAAGLSEEQAARLRELLERRQDK